MALLNGLLFGEHGGVSKTKLGSIVALVMGLASIWGWDIDPRWLQTIGALGLGTAVVGARDAIGRASEGDEVVDGS